MIQSAHAPMIISMLHIYRQTFSLIAYFVILHQTPVIYMVSAAAKKRQYWNEEENSQEMGILERIKEGGGERKIF